ncbi:cytochrome P450 [Westerdykella ornata]|uniref:Cytochrome P450 n=1 Tax=Westerdykella ornata TaxID=318751 RepID=A0A6A6J4Q5_WESOR|nr:cytochrome P450 [Westerdykella ornata]KAF2271560.1 cytochrome P450 [Westerdykella ornata]
MAVHFRLWLLSAIVISFIGSHYSHTLLVFSHSFLWNAVALYLTLQSANLIWEIIIYPFCFSPLRHLPQAPGANFLLGHYKRIFQEPTGEPQRDWIDSVPNDGVIYYRWLLNRPRVLITSPKALAEVLVQRNYEFTKPARLRKGLGRLLGVGILVAEGDEHKRQRKALMPAFSFRHIKDLYPIFWSKSREMVQAMLTTIQSPPTPSANTESPTTTDPSVVEIRDWASRATLDIIGVAGMGQDFHSLADPDNELFKTYRTIFSPMRGRRIFQLIMMLLPEELLDLLPLERNTQIKKAIVTIKKVAKDLIQTKRANLADGKARDLDILSVAIESGGFSDDDLINQLMTFLAAGHETTASAVTWAVYLLCKHPDVQAKLRDELRSSGILTALHSASGRNDAGEEITSRHIDALPYLSAVLSESLRLFPPVPQTLRESPPYHTTIANHPVPPSTTVIISPWAINTSYALWGPDARAFNPDRWLGPGRANTGGAESNFASTTFLHGPRSCIGMGFAKGEFACLMAALVGAFEMRLRDEEEEIDITGGITARPRNGLWVKLTPVGQ